jgi:hypothetical protein
MYTVLYCTVKGRVALRLLTFLLLGDMSCTVKGRVAHRLLTSVLLGDMYCTVKGRVAHRLVSSTRLSALNQVISGMGCASSAHSITKFSPSCRIVGLCGNLRRIFCQNSPIWQKTEVFETSGALEGKPCSNSAIYMHVTRQVNTSCDLILFLDI